MLNRYCIVALVLLGSATGLAAQANAQQEGRFWKAGDRYGRFQIGMATHYFESADSVGIEVSGDGVAVSTTDNAQGFSIGGAIGLFASDIVSTEVEVSFADAPSRTYVIESPANLGLVSFKRSGASVLTIAANAAVHAPYALSPYVGGGLGLMRSGQISSEGETVSIPAGGQVGVQVAGEPASTKFMFNLGGGIDLDAFRIEYRHFIAVDASDTESVGRFVVGFTGPF